MYRGPYQQFPLAQTRTGIPAYSSTLPTAHRANSIVQSSAGQQLPTSQQYLRQNGFTYGAANQQSVLTPTLLGGGGGQQQQHAAPVNAGGSSSDPQLDPNDFPALGAGGVSSGTGNLNPAASSNSYASQAQQPVSGQQQQPQNQPTTNGISRDFSNQEEFPALGGQSSIDTHGGTTHSALPSLINSSGVIQQRNSASLLQPEDKRIYGMKHTPQSAHSSWNQQIAASYAQPPTTNGVSQTPISNSLGQQQSGPGTIAPQQPQQQQLIGRVASVGRASTPDPNPPVAQHHGQSHTPADQVLHSAADRWGLLALVRALRHQTEDALSSGQDLGLLGLELDNPGSLYLKFATPWADYGGAPQQTEPNYHLPSCYNVAPPAPSHKKVAQWNDETLFFAFYSMPRDIFQDLAAQELYNRNWRYHKELRIWITQEASPTTTTTGANDSSALFTVWDVESWERVQKSLSIDFRELESKGSVGAVGAERQQQQSQPPQQQQQQFSSHARV